jgi:hypothetical protein
MAIKNEQLKSKLLELTREQMRIERRTRVTAFAQRINSPSRKVNTDMNAEACKIEETADEDVISDGDDNFEDSLGMVRPSMMIKRTVNSPDKGVRATDGSGAEIGDTHAILVNEGYRKSSQRNTVVLPNRIAAESVVEVEDEDNVSRESESSESSIDESTQSSSSSSEDESVNEVWDSTHRMSLSFKALSNISQHEALICPSTTLCLDPLGIDFEISVYYHITRERLCVEARMLHERYYFCIELLSAHFFDIAYQPPRNVSVMLVTKRN